MTDLRHQIAQAIHDGPTAQQAYKDAGIEAHSFADCDYADQYLADADAVIASLSKLLPKDVIERAARAATTYFAAVNYDDELGQRGQKMARASARQTLFAAFRGD